MDRAADTIRILAAAMVEKAKSGHPGGAMGAADFINVLYSSVIQNDPDDPEWFARDRFFLDPGHMSAMLYAVLALEGKYTIEELQDFRQWGSTTPGHPELDVKKGIENSSGPLGQGHAMAVGCALAERFLVARYGECVSHKTYAFISDGGIQEEISQGAGRIAGYLGLGNLIMFYDSNKVQLSTIVDEVTDEDVAAKYRAWNWNVIEINGSDPVEIFDALEIAGNNSTRPTLIIGHTIMGRGCVTANGENFEGRTSTHGQPLSKSGADYPMTVKNLGGDPENPWNIPADVKELYKKRAEVLRGIVARRRAEMKKWEAENPVLAARLKDEIAGKLPKLDWENIAHKPGVATRVASANCLEMLSRCLNNMIVSSADLANSDKTDAFLKHTTALRPGDFNGAFLHAGVAELTMASIINGLVLHGGVIAACGTFFVFSDYMKPAIRMAALMELPVKYIWTHDAFRVGEDGPTHEPIEQEAQIRLLEELKNFNGRPSVLVLRPADSYETTVSWEMAMENTHTPTALILSRQDVPELPSESKEESYRRALGTRKGGYAVIECENPDITLVANGSEVSLLVDVEKRLSEKGIKVRVVSVPSTGLFNIQSKEYRESVIPSEGKVYGLTAGLPSTLASVVGKDAYIHGLDRFGASAPFKVLEEKFGFTTEAVLKEIEEFLNRK